MDWLANNVPLISDIAVAALSFLTSFVKFLNEQNASTKMTQRLKEYSDIYASLPDTTKARGDIAKLLKIEAERLLRRTNRKLNIANMIAVIVVALVGGGLSYIFALWAMDSAHIALTILAWLLFSFVAFFTLGISIAGLASMYEEPKEKKPSKDTQI